MQSVPGRARVRLRFTIGPILDEILLPGPDGVPRCWWPGDDPLYIRYHDEEWGRPVHDDRRLFEKLCLEGFQAGLAWITVLRKRPAFRDVFAGFDPATVAGFDESDVQRLLQDARIIRHQGKIEATIANARCYGELVAEHGSLDAYIWTFAPDRPPPAPRTPADLRATSPESVAMSKDLKRRGWRFLGPTTVYAFMQAMGLVDDHVGGCAFRGAR